MKYIFIVKRVFICLLLTGIPVTENMLRKVAELSHVYEVGDNYLPEAFMEEYQHIIAKPEDIKPRDCVNAFIYLKENYSNVH